MELAHTPDGPSPVQSPTQSISPPLPLQLPPAFPHIHPITWEELDDFDPPPDTRVEVVDGFLVYHTDMGSPQHGNVATNGGMSIQLSQPHIVVHFASVVQVPPSTTASRLRVTVPSFRLPDLIFEKDLLQLPSTSSNPNNGSPTTSGSTSPNSSPTSLRRRNQYLVNNVARRRMTFALDKPPYGVAEITSPSTRSVDLFAKWLAYAAAAIEWYFIFDLAAEDGRLRLIAGSLARRSGFQRAASGDPDAPAAVPAVSQDTSNDKHVYYYRRVYDEDELVDCKILSVLDMTPSQMMRGDGLKRFLKSARQRAHVSEHQEGQWRANISRQLRGHEEEEAERQQAFNEAVEQAVAEERRAAAAREAAIREKAQRDQKDLKHKLARKDGELERKDGELARKDGELERKDGELARKDRELKNLRETAERDKREAERDKREAERDKREAVRKALEERDREDAKKETNGGQGGSRSLSTRTSHRKDGASMPRRRSERVTGRKSESSKRGRHSGRS